MLEIYILCKKGLKDNIIYSCPCSRYGVPGFTPCPMEGSWEGVASWSLALSGCGDDARNPGRGPPRRWSVDGGNGLSDLSGNFARL